MALVYFCAECQRRHPATDIAIDLRDLLRERAGDAARRALQSEEAYRNVDLTSAVSIFCNNEKVSQRSGFFVFEGSELLAENSDKVTIVNRGRPTEYGRYLDCELNATLGDLLPEVIDKLNRNPNFSGMTAEEIEEEQAKLYELSKQLSEKQKTTNLFIDEMTGKAFSLRIYFTPDNVVDHFVDCTDTPFVVDEMSYGYDRVCPHCGKKLFQVVGKAEETVILLVGSPRAGKTCSVTATLSAMRRSGILRLENPVNDPQHRKIEEEMRKYEQGTAVIKTPPKLDEVPASSFLIMVGSKKRVITFVDMPGEFWATDEGISADFFKYYAQTLDVVDCIWYFASKLMIYNNRNLAQCEAGSETPDIVAGASATFVSAAFRNLATTMRIRGRQVPPIAMIVTKSELDLGLEDEQNREDFNLYPLGDPVASNQKALKSVTEKPRVMKKSLQYLTKQWNWNGPYLWEREFFITAENTRRFIANRAGAFCRAVEENFPCHTYISTASYGFRPAAEGEAPVGTPRPFHELFPLLWTLAVTGGMPIMHECSWEIHGFLGRHKGNKECYIPCWFDYRSAITQGELREITGNIRKNLLMNPNNTRYQDTRFKYTFNKRKRQR